MRRLAVALAAAAAIAGCDLSAGEDKTGTRHEPRDLGSREARLIRDWLQALEHEDYGHAATFFAPGAIVDQGRPFRLHSRAEARFFNATLPCRADLIALKHEGSAKVLATFRLRAGPGGPCDGLVRVHYTIERGRFTEWRQLPRPSPEVAPTV
jgi:hypothetical protein